MSPHPSVGDPSGVFDAAEGLLEGGDASLLLPETSGTPLGLAAELIWVHGCPLALKGYVRHINVQKHHQQSRQCCSVAHDVNEVGFQGDRVMFNSVSGVGVRVRQGDV